MIKNSEPVNRKIINFKTYYYKELDSIFREAKHEKNQCQISMVYDSKSILDECTANQNIRKLTRTIDSKTLQKIEDLHNMNIRGGFFPHDICIDWLDIILHVILENEDDLYIEEIDEKLNKCIVKSDYIARNTETHFVKNVLNAIQLLPDHIRNTTLSYAFTKRYVEVIKYTLEIGVSKKRAAEPTFFEFIYREPSDIVVSVFEKEVNDINQNTQRDIIFLQNMLVNQLDEDLFAFGMDIISKYTDFWKETTGLHQGEEILNTLLDRTVKTPSGVTQFIYKFNSFIDYHYQSLEKITHLSFIDWKEQRDRSINTELISLYSDFS